MRKIEPIVEGSVAVLVMGPPGCHLVEVAAALESLGYPSPKTTGTSVEAASMRRVTVSRYVPDLLHELWEGPCTIIERLRDSGYQKVLLVFPVPSWSVSVFNTQVGAGIDPEHARANYQNGYAFILNDLFQTPMRIGPRRERPIVPEGWMFLPTSHDIDSYWGKDGLKNELHHFIERHV